MTNIEKAKQAVEEALTKANSLVKGNAAELESALSALTQAEKEYKTLREREVFDSIASVKDAIIQLSFKTLGHKRLSDDGRLTGFEAEDKTVLIDLKRFCDYKQLPTDWWYELQAFNKRLTIRVARNLEISEDAIKAIDDSYHMNELAKKIALGEDPASNTACVKHLQAVLDALCDNKGGRVTNKDLYFILFGYSKLDKRSALKIVCSKHTYLLSLVTKAFHAVVTGKPYEVDYKKIDESKRLSNAADKAMAEKAAETEASVQTDKGKGKTEGSKTETEVEKTTAA